MTRQEAVAAMQAISKAAWEVWEYEPHTKFGIASARLSLDAELIATLLQQGEGAYYKTDD